MTNLDDAIRRIVRGFRPAKIILFGSHTRGPADFNSDVDMLIVMDVEGSKRRKAVEIDLALSDRTFPLDIIVVTTDEFEKYQNVIGHILYSVMREGRVVYDAGSMYESQCPS
jgi:predicted nucleotidyltransferase